MFKPPTTSKEDPEYINVAMTSTENANQAQPSDDVAYETIPVQRKNLPDVSKVVVFSVNSLFQKVCFRSVLYHIFLKT